MKIKNILLISLLAIGFCGCSEEDSLEPSGTEVGFKMPQGNHDYDDRIMEYYEKYNGVCLLYRYEEKDAYWTARYYYKTVFDPLTQTYNPYGPNGATGFYYFQYENPDTNYINQHLDLLEESFFNLYKEEALKKYLPLKLLLASTLTNAKTKTLTEAVNAKAIYDETIVQLLFAGCNASIEEMTTEEKETYSYDVNRMFLYEYLASGKLMEIPLAFSEVSTYSTTTVSDMPTLYKNGLLNSSASMSYETDWKNFMDAIFTTPYEDMIAYYPDTDRTYKGMLCSDKSNGQKPKDSTGKIREKYEAMVEYFQEEFGIDIRRFANK